MTLSGDSSRPSNDEVIKSLEIIEALHTVAVQAREESYIDPKTGYSVMTELYLKAQGTCCQSGCRHCPYGYELPNNI